MTGRRPELFGSCDEPATGHACVVLDDRTRLPAHRGESAIRETALGLFNGRDRRQVAVVVTTDGRRVQVPLDELGLANDVSLLGILRSLALSLAGLLGQIGRASCRERV